MCTMQLWFLMLGKQLLLGKHKRQNVKCFGERISGNAHGVEDVIASYEDDVDCYLNVKDEAQTEDAERVRIR